MAAIAPAAPVAAAAQAAERDTDVQLGSYGRVAAATTEAGETVEPINVVGHGPRLEEAAYLELDVRARREAEGGGRFAVHATPAIAGPLFHQTGRFEADLAVRNLYAEAEGLIARPVSVWAGSRMLRGDDIYLLDFWPLDNLNTVGGGASLDLGRTRAGVHAGLSALDDPFLQQRRVIPGLVYGAEEVEFLDRQKRVASARAERFLLGGADGGLGLKVKAYGELHGLPSGERLRERGEVEELPADRGWLAGAQVGVWNFLPRSFANLFVRHARGLAAYGDLAVPFGLAPDRTTGGARETLAALSANVETRWAGVMLGGYARRFRDADPNRVDLDDGWEYVAVARPHVYLHRHFYQAFEASWQARRPEGSHPETGAREAPAVVKLSALPVVTAGGGSYGRPQVRGVYTFARLNDSARLSYPREDPRRARATVHVLGLQAEWWFNSSYL